MKKKIEYQTWVKERNIFCIPFPTEFLCRKEGLCRGWTQKDENR